MFITKKTFWTFPLTEAQKIRAWEDWTTPGVMAPSNHHVYTCIKPFILFVLLASYIFDSASMVGYDAVVNNWLTFALIVYILIQATHIVIEKFELFNYDHYDEELRSTFLNVEHLYILYQMHQVTLFISIEYLLFGMMIVKGGATGFVLGTLFFAFCIKVLSLRSDARITKMFLDRDIE